MRRGKVVSFDDSAGWGTVRANDGTEWFFHCTQIADGTRTIDVGENVTFLLKPIGLGTWEATELRSMAT